MNPLYMTDSYMKEFDATVVGAEGGNIELDNTAFYPNGGGQPNDIGKIICNGAEYSVTNIIKRDGRIIHEVDRQGLKAGDVVHGIIDWQRRYMLMRMHTAAHVISAIINMESGALITGNQLDVDKSRIDFSLDNMDKDAISAYIAKANEAVSSGIKVEISFMNREEAMKIQGMVKLAGALPPNVRELRIVRIGDIDMQADGGTHVASTAEVGKIELLKLENKGKNNRRIYYNLK